MHLAKFIFIDIFVFFAISLLIFIFFKDYKNKTLQNPMSNREKEIPLNIPELTDLIKLEKISRKEGTGIQFNELIGVWSFYSVWNQNKDYQDSISSKLLRIFSAQLELKEIKLKESINLFEIINSIEFGLLSIRFLGLGSLKGNQPILPFYFEKIELKFGTNSFLSRSLQTPKEKDRPFFSLIYLNKEEGWLSARGRGGGLALWKKVY